MELRTVRGLKYPQQPVHVFVLGTKNVPINASWWERLGRVSKMVDGRMQRCDEDEHPSDETGVRKD